MLSNECWPLYLKRYRAYISRWISASRVTNKVILWLEPLVPNKMWAPHEAASHSLVIYKRAFLWVLQLSGSWFFCRLSFSGRNEYFFPFSIIFFLKTESCLFSLSHSANSLAAFVVGSRRCVHTLVCSCRWHRCGLISWGLKSTFFLLRVQVLSPVLLHLWSRSESCGLCQGVCPVWCCSPSGGHRTMRMGLGAEGGRGCWDSWGAAAARLGVGGDAWLCTAAGRFAVLWRSLCSSIELWVVCRACVVLQITSLYSNRRIIMQPTRGIQWNGLSVQK